MFDYFPIPELDAGNCKKVGKRGWAMKNKILIGIGVVVVLVGAFSIVKKVSPVGWGLGASLADAYSRYAFSGSQYILCHPPSRSSAASSGKPVCMSSSVVNSPDWLMSKRTIE
jgi:hypothetical protein